MLTLCEFSLSTTYADFVLVPAVHRIYRLFTVHHINELHSPPHMLTLCEFSLSTAYFDSASSRSPPNTLSDLCSFLLSNILLVFTISDISAVTTISAIIIDIF